MSDFTLDELRLIRVALRIAADATSRRSARRRVEFLDLRYRISEKIAEKTHTDSTRQRELLDDRR